MKILQIVQTNFAILGISSNQSNLNRKSAMGIIVGGLAATSSAMFLLFKANSFVEYVNSFYVTTVLVAFYICFAVLLFSKEKIFKLIDKVDECVEGSELLGK